MNMLLINSATEFDDLTARIDSLAEDYREFLTHFLEMKEEPYSLDYVYARLFMLKGYFERALAGLDQTSFRYPVAQKLDGRLQNFFLQKALLDQRLHGFIRNSSLDDSLRQKLKFAADSTEVNIKTETFLARITLKDDDDLNSMDVIDAIATLDDLRLHLDERKQLGLEFAFRLQHSQASLEENFSGLEKLFWNNLPLLLEFRQSIKEYRDRFLIFQDKKYPWWYPEKRKAKSKPMLQADDQTTVLKVA